MNATNFNNNNQLPKFQDTFDSGNTWSANSSRRGSLENNTGSIFGNSSRKVDIAEPGTCTRRQQSRGWRMEWRCRQEHPGGKVAGVAR